MSKTRKHNRGPKLNFTLKEQRNIKVIPTVKTHFTLLLSETVTNFDFAEITETIIEQGIYHQFQIMEIHKFSYFIFFAVKKLRTWQSACKYRNLMQKWTKPLNSFPNLNNMRWKWHRRAAITKLFATTLSNRQGKLEMGEVNEEKSFFFFLYINTYMCMYR